MATASTLRVGETYYVVTFEDESLMRPLIDTYEFLGKDIDGALSSPSNHEYYFRIVETDGHQVILTETQIWQLLDIDGLLERLADFRDGKVSWIPDTSSC